MCIIGQICIEIQKKCTSIPVHDKYSTHKHTGPLHPLLILDDRGDSMAIDFIGQLPLDENFNCILSMTNHLGSDIQIVLTQIDITAEELALLFFNH